MAAVNNQGVKVILYWLSESRAHRILWLLEDLNIPYEVKVYQRTKRNLAPPEMKEIHPMGKAPIIAISREGHKDLVMVESGLIIEYLIDHWGPHLKPKRYLEGQDGQAGGETESYMRDRWFIHMSEGSLMPLLVFQLLTSAMRSKNIPFFIRPITSFIAGKIEGAALHPRIHEQLEYIEELTKTAPDGGPYLCGSSLTGSDFMMSYPLQGAQQAGLITKQRYPHLTEWITRIEALPAYNVAVEKTKEINGKFELFPAM